jgi:hypothetical protein
MPNTNPVPIWTSDIENVLNSVRLNAYTMSEVHRKRYHYLKHVSHYFDIPVILISAVNTIISVGIQPFVSQENISITNCVLSAFCGIIVSIKLYLAIQSQMDVELTTSKDYYALSTEIYKTLSLLPANRGIDGMIFLNNSFQSYEDLVQKSNLLYKKIKDKMVPDKIPPLPQVQDVKQDSSGNQIINPVVNGSSRSLV